MKIVYMSKECLHHAAEANATKARSNNIDSFWFCFIRKHGDYVMALNKDYDNNCKEFLVYSSCLYLYHLYGPGPVVKT